VPKGAQTCKINSRQGHGKKNPTGSGGEKNQANAGRVSQYTSPLQRNVSLFSQAIGSQASIKNAQLIYPNPAFSCNNGTGRFLQLDIGLKFLNFFVTNRHRLNRTMEVGYNPGTVTLCQIIHCNRLCKKVIKLPRQQLEQ
jgi:hypothetical protein